MNNIYGKKESQAFKGIAVIVLLWLHLFQNEDVMVQYGLSGFPLSAKFTVDLALYAGQCLALFAFASGYGLFLNIRSFEQKNENSRPGFGLWIVTRYIKTFSGYWFVFIVAAIVTTLIDNRFYSVMFKGESLFDGLFFSILNFLGLSYFFGMPTQCSAWWYMSAALAFIVLSPILYKAITKYNGLVVLCVLSVVPRVLGISYPSKIYSLVMPFAIGMVFAKNNTFNQFHDWQVGTNRLLSNVGKGVGLILVNSLAFYIYMKTDFELFWDLQRGYLAIPLVLFIVCYLVQIPVLNRVLAFLGKHSMNIFLVHIFIKTTYLKEQLYWFHNTFIICLVLLLSSLVISMLIELLKKLVRFNLMMDKIIIRIQKAH